MLTLSAGTKQRIDAYGFAVIAGVLDLTDLLYQVEDADGAMALHNAKTIEQLALALAHFIEQQGPKSVVAKDSDY